MVEQPSAQHLHAHPDKMEGLVQRRYGPKIVFLVLALCLVFALQQFNYLLFHSFVETFSIVIACGIFILAWNTRRFSTDGFLAVLGVAYLCVAVLDFVHVLTYPGMTVIPGIADDAAIQLWLATRFLESLSLFIAPFFLHRTCDFRWLAFIYTAICLAIIASIFVWPVFPTCHIPGQGLTAFKKYGEYLITAILGVSIYILHRRRQALVPDVRRFIIAAIALTIASELAFTLYVDPYGLFNAVGHILKFASFFLIYMAIIETGIIRPFGLIIKDLQRKEASLLDSRAAFKATIDASTDIIMLVDPRFKCMALNQSALVFFKASAEDMNGRKLARILPAETSERLLRPIANVFETGVPAFLEEQMGDATYSLMLHPIFNHSGVVEQVAVIFKDISHAKVLEQRLLSAHDELENRVTQRTLELSDANRQLEQAVAVRSSVVTVLKEKNLMLRTLVRAIPDMVALKDRQGRHLIANPAYRAFFGLDHKRVVGFTDQEIHPSRAGKFFAAWDQQVIVKGQPLKFETPLMSTAGEEIHWDIRKVPVKDTDGALLGVLSLARDITPFKQREEQLQQSKALLQSFLDGISEPMLMLDEDLHPVYVNRAAKETLPPKGNAATEERCHHLLCGDATYCNECPVAQRIADKRYHSFERKRGGDPERIEKVDLIPLAMEKDGLDGTIVRITDLTEIKQLEQHLIHSEKMNALGMLVSGIVHEINNPNSFITFNLPILRTYLEKIFHSMDVHSDELNRSDWFGMAYNDFRTEIFNLLENLSHGSTRIDQIVNNLKAISHPRLVSADNMRADLSDVINKAVTLCRNKIQKHVKEFDVDLLPETVWLQADPEGLEQVIINLLINAAQAADKQASWERLKTRGPDEKNRLATIEISDNGCGIEADHLKRIFDPFFTTKSPGVGTGLGLSVSYNLIQQMGGRINVNSSPRRGATFTIQLPVANDSAQDLSATAFKRHAVQ